MNKKRGRKPKIEPLPEMEEVKIKPIPEKHLYHVWEVAQLFSVVERTVRMWLEHGKLKSIRTPGGQIRITKESVDAWRYKIEERNRN